jgi:hypothetical protein
MSRQGRCPALFVYGEENDLKNRVHIVRDGNMKDVAGLNELFMANWVIGDIVPFGDTGQMFILGRPLRDDDEDWSPDDEEDQ